MELKMLKIIKRSITSNKTTKKEMGGKYNKILSNLLSINNRSDNAIFTKLSAINKDLTKLISNSDIAKMYMKNSFKIKIKKISLKDIKSSIENSSSPSEILSILNQTDYKITKVLEKGIYSSFEKEKLKILEKISGDENTFITKWKKYQKNINDSFTQTNIWPLFVSSYFIQGIISGKSINAPLLLKQVDIIIENNEVYLVSKNDSLIINDKLVFFLEQELKIDIPIIDSNVDKTNFETLTYELDYFFKNIIEIKHIDLMGEFKNLNTQDIIDPNLIKTDGMVLIHCQPSGGALRNATFDLIQSGEIENLLHIDDQLINFNHKAIENMVNNDLPIARICPTDASQEKAILASLAEHAIIIGPPGTGKSQTIANLLTNILQQNKKALFISQKRVALEVVIERMGELRYFMLQLVENSNKTDGNEKEFFYHSLNKYMNYIKDYSPIQPKAFLNPLISEQMKNYWNLKQINSDLTQEDIDIFCEINSRSYDGKPIDIEKIKKVLNNILKFKQINQYDNIEKILSFKELDIKRLASKLNVEPKKILGFIKVYHKSFKTLHQLNINLLEFLRETNGDIEIITYLKKVKSIDEMDSMTKAYSTLINELPTTNKFVSDEEAVLANIIDISYKKMKDVFERKNKEDKSWSRKFLGRIDRAYTVPSNFINLFKKELKEMFNIVVSTPESLSTFVNFKKDKYDYVIFDEASQIFLEKAIPYISVGTKIIIAGDDQQMQPSNWFSTRVNPDESISEMDEAENIDSLLSYAIANSLPKYTLELNYRSSSAALTTFSSKEFYNSKLKTLDANSAKEKAIEVIDVSGEWIDNTNLQEVIKMIEILKENIQKYSKIILLTLNKHQLDLLNDVLAEQEPIIYDLILNGKIILKNLENIQGDEADLVIISIGYTKSTTLASTYVGRSGGRNALNVAITRAKTKMIILKSILSNDIKITNENNADLIAFKQWINFLELTELQQKEYSIRKHEENTSVESHFENEVHNWLIKQQFNKELHLVTQYAIGSYRIDLALIDSLSGKFILGIEVDGFKYHSSPTQKYNDIIRQDFIEAKGYKLIRISEILWKTNKSEVLKLIKNNI